MLSKKIENALNEQINTEMWSAYLYLSMSLDLDNKGRKGIANWFKVQFQEEQAHALALIDYLQARSGRVELKPIAGVPTTWNSVREIFNETLEHERKISGMINALYSMAEEEHDYATRQKLNTFIAEQVEEEETVVNILDDLTLVGEDGVGIFQLDRELGQRQFVAPQL
ncbi:MAG: ferritin [Bacteroidales bacterium]|nr:ferritin [Bacteroidales bacterium]MDE7465750.1 ferritin [Muribaculaceae bacterium]